MLIKCDKCGKLYAPGNRPDGCPNGVGFKLADGSIYNVCADCLINLGKEIEGKAGEELEDIGDDI